MHWANARYKARDCLLTKIEKSLSTLLQEHLREMFSEEAMEWLDKLEIQKKKLLLDREKDWGIKSRETWLSLGGQNTKYFHMFDNFRNI